MYFLRILFLCWVSFSVCEISENQIQKSQWREIFGRKNSLAPSRFNQRTGGFNNRQNRFLSLFTLVQFENEQCMGATGDVGTCMTSADCQQRGGTSNGVCANGYGTCCIFLASCGTTVRENGTFFVQTNYPSAYDETGSCQITLLKSRPDVCQYRLDFDQFLVVGPENQHNTCNNDQFIVSGGNPVPSICGNNMGNHMYVDAGAGTTTPIILSMITSGPSFQRNWKIKIHQILCGTSCLSQSLSLQDLIVHSWD
nr:uncharacterized protein LOC111426814 [Onthophagus taurus]